MVNLRRMRQDFIAEHFGALAELRDAGLKKPVAAVCTVWWKASIARHRPGGRTRRAGGVAATSLTHWARPPVRCQLLTPACLAGA